MSDEPIIFCELSPERSNQIANYAEALRDVAPMVGEHGLSETEFWESGIFYSAIERLRGQRAAATRVKHQFVGTILENLQKAGLISSWEFSGAVERHDYEVRFPGPDAKSAAPAADTVLPPG